MTRRSARIKNLNPSCIEVESTVQVPEVTNSDHINLKEDVHIQKVDVESSECESEAPEEVPFEKSKAIFMEESSVIRNAVTAKKKRRVLPASVLSVVSKQISNESLQENDTDEEIISSICTEEFSSVPRIRAVSLKSLHRDYGIDQKVVLNEDSKVKKNKFCKVKLGPADHFLVNRN